MRHTNPLDSARKITAEVWENRMRAGYHMSSPRGDAQATVEAIDDPHMRQAPARRIVPVMSLISLTGPEDFPWR